MNRKRFKLILLLCIFLLPVMFYACAAVMMNVRPVSRKKAESIVPGMTRQQVISVLSNPSRIRKTQTREYWVYSRPMLWNFFVVEFKNKKVSSAYWDD